jgi:hypothetical protein
MQEKLGQSHRPGTAPVLVREYAKNEPHTELPSDSPLAADCDQRTSLSECSSFCLGTAVIDLQADQANLFHVARVLTLLLLDQDDILGEKAPRQILRDRVG